MKANQKARDMISDERAETPVKKYIGVFVLGILALATLGVAASFYNTASEDPNFTAAQVVMLGLIVLALILMVVIVIFRTAAED